MSIRTYIQCNFNTKVCSFEEKFAVYVLSNSNYYLVGISNFLWQCVWLKRLQVHSYKLQLRKAWYSWIYCSSIAFQSMASLNPSMLSHPTNRLQTDKPITQTCPCNILQYFTVVKKVIFKWKNVILFLFLLKTNIDRGYTLEPPHWLTSTHDLCFRAKIRKIYIYPGKPQFSYTKVGWKGVFITRTCFHDASWRGRKEVTPCAMLAKTMQTTYITYC